jgi:type VI secretion system secreted protein VgrG
VLGGVVVVAAVLANDATAGRGRGGPAGSVRSMVDRSVGMLVVRRLLNRPDPYAAALPPPVEAPAATAERVPTRPTRIVVSGTPRPVSVRGPAPAATRLRLARDAGGMLVGVGAVVLLAMIVLPSGGVLGSTAPPEPPAQVTFGSPNQPPGSAPAVVPQASRLEPLLLPSTTPPRTEAPTAVLSTASPTTVAPEATATRSPTATPTRRPPSTPPPATPKPTPSPKPSPSPTPTPTSTPTPTPEPTESPPSPDPTPDPTPDVPPSAP